MDLPRSIKGATLFSSHHLMSLFLSHFLLQTSSQLATLTAYLTLDFLCRQAVLVLAQLAASPHSQIHVIPLLTNTEEPQHRVGVLSPFTP